MKMLSRAVKFTASRLRGLASGQMRRFSVYGEMHFCHAFKEPTPPSMFLRFLLPVKSQQTAFAFVTKQ